MKLTPEDKEWALSVKQRDSMACVICGSTERLNSHHLIPREIKEFKYDIDNGVTLCVKHHMFSRKISAHNNPIAFFKWLCEHRPVQANKAFERCEYDTG